MMLLGRRIYFDSTTGQVLIDLGERKGDIKPTTIEQDILSYKVLSERNRESFDYIQLEYGEFNQDFLSSNSYRINVDTRNIEFNYRNTNDDTLDIPVFQESLTEKISLLEKENILLKAQNKALSERTDFHEEVLAEIILTITP